MSPLFDRFGNLVAWSKDGHLFDTDFNWIAFRSDNHLFAKASANWLGPFDGAAHDRSGNPVAVPDGARPQRMDRSDPPPRPVCPVMPLRPMRPAAHVRPRHMAPQSQSWSDLSWTQWLNQR